MRRPSPDCGIEPDGNVLPLQEFESVMTEIVVIRPGCTDYDTQHRIQGTLDLPLNEKGEDQVEKLVRKLNGTEVDVIYSAHCEPALSTAEALGESLKAPVKELDGLRNLNHGLWQGLTVEDIRRKFPKAYKQWMDSPESICPPEGETVSEAMDRIRESLQKPLKKKQSIAIVASEPLATLIVCVMTGCKPEFEQTDRSAESCPAVEWIHVNGKLPGTLKTNGHAVAAEKSAE